MVCRGNLCTCRSRGPAPLAYTITGLRCCSTHIHHVVIAEGSTVVRLCDCVEDVTVVRLCECGEDV